MYLHTNINQGHPLYVSALLDRHKTHVIEAPLSLYTHHPYNQRLELVLSHKKRIKVSSSQSGLSGK